MDPNTILTKILRRYGVLTEDIRSLQIVESKIKNKIATYADAEDAAIKIGKALRTALAENLPDALTDGRLYRAVAEVVLEQPMKEAGKDVADIASAIQKELNEEAGLGMNPVVPEMNQDQIDGIVTGICNADSYEAGKDVMLDQVENCLEGYVDDFVRENADFQYKAGLSPTIERKISGKCCEWCAKLAGSYPYEDVSDRGNDVFRRHRNCHCQSLYNPGNGSKKRQNVRSRQWTEDGKADRILFAKSGSAENGFRTTADPMREAMGSGEISHPQEVAAFRREAAARGVNIVEHEYESLGYSPALFAGSPGVLYISKGASYSAWCHEMQHMRDDYEAGWSGMRILSNPEERFNREKRAYDIEIKMAEEIGRPDLAQRLKQNMENARRNIYGVDK